MEWAKFVRFVESLFPVQIVSRWEEFVDKAKQEAQPTTVIKLFPFTQFFANAPQPIFNGKSFEEDMRAAEGCFGHLRKMHEFLDECRTFEVLRTYQERANYLVTTQAKIIAMTCTHAALKRHDFVRLDFEFDTLIMEEAAQVLEVETFIPLMLQKPERAGALRTFLLLRWLCLTLPLICSTLEEAGSYRRSQPAATCCAGGYSACSLDV